MEHVRRRATGGARSLNGKSTLNSELNNEAPAKKATSIPFAVCALVLMTVVLIPFQIVGQGYLPDDDALRHAGKAVSGKDWHQILVLRPEFTMDSHPGWHAILGAIHQATDCSAHSLILISLIGLFVWFCLGPILFLRRPEAWLASLIVLGVAELDALSRLFLARPLVFTAGVLVMICFMWKRLDTERRPWPILVTITALLAIAVWIHPSWYLYAVPLAAFFLAGQWRVGVRLGACLAAGVLIGALFTGHPLQFVTQSLLHGYLAMGSFEPQATLVGEFRPFSGSPLMVVAIALMLGWRALRGSREAGITNDPVFLIVVLGWVLGFVSSRFWSDWGIPAAMAWMALEFQDGFEKQVGSTSLRRVALAAATGTACFLALSSNSHERYTNFDRSFWALGKPEATPLLPGPGGIAYSDDMRLFFQTFYHYPQAAWRYQLGFEPAMMPPEDLEVYRAVRTGRTAEAFAPWIRKMKPPDRLILLSTRQPAIQELEWSHAGGGIWSGRLR